MYKNYFLIGVFVFVKFTFAQNTYSDHYYKLKAQFERTPDTENEIIFLGNSITAGGNWDELFPDINAVNRGISGDVTDGIINRLKEVTSSKPLKIFLLIGTNDLAREKSVSEITDNYRTIIEKIQEQSSNTKIYIQTVLPVNPYVGRKFAGHKSRQTDIIALNKNLKSMALDFHIQFINLYEPLANAKKHLKPKYTYDGLHLSAKGYKKWVEQIEQYVYE